MVRADEMAAGMAKIDVTDTVPRRNRRERGFGRVRARFGSKAGTAAVPIGFDRCDGGRFDRRQSRNRTTLRRTIARGALRLRRAPYCSSCVQRKSAADLEAGGQTSDAKVRHGVVF